MIFTGLPIRFGSRMGKNVPLETRLRFSPLLSTKFLTVGTRRRLLTEMGIRLSFRMPATTTIQLARFQRSQLQSILLEPTRFQVLFRLKCREHSTLFPVQAFILSHIRSRFSRICSVAICPFPPARGDADLAIASRYSAGR